MWGRTRSSQMLREMGANDLQHAFDRACLQGKLETARKLYTMGARPTPGCVMGPCETLSDSGLEFLLELGAELADEHGDRLAPVALLLRDLLPLPGGQASAAWNWWRRAALSCPIRRRWRCIADGSICWKRICDVIRSLLNRTFSHEEIYPPALGCHADHSLALHGTPLAATTLLHMCVDFDEIEMARWLIEHGADVNARAEVDADGFGGHTPLFGCVVSQSYLCRRQQDAEFARLLLDHGADPNVRVSLRKRLRFVPDESMHEFRDVTPISWGEQFHGPGSPGTRGSASRRCS